MANPKYVFKSFDKLTFNPFETENLLLEYTIDQNTNMFNDSKFQKLNSPCYTPDELIVFSKELSGNIFSIFHLNVSVTLLEILERLQGFNDIVLTETWLKNENTDENKNFLYQIHIHQIHHIHQIGMGSKKDKVSPFLNINH